uniref:transmembrane protein 14B-like isoform X4 n=1 Tax=Callithrix jacchus TaxID=9483 RepID=UPI0023DD31B1|nr:transmembrane protein 14B-like isoform X4 [Callithrix jacchus]
MEKGFIPIVPLLWLGYGYTALVASRGIFGYVKTGRVPSLVVELFFSSLAGLGSYQLSQDPKNVWLFLGADGWRFYSVVPFCYICLRSHRWLRLERASPLLFSPMATTLT